MKVANDRIVTFVFQLVDERGTQIDQALSDAPIQYLHGHQKLNHGLDKRLEGHPVYDQLVFTVEIPAPSDHQYFLASDRNGCAPEGAAPRLGTPFLAEIQGEQHVAWVTKVSPEGVSLTTADPLAGRTLRFAVTITAVWKATADELRRGCPSGVVPNTRRRNFSRSGG